MSTPFDANDPEAPWNNPDTSLIRLLSGKTVTVQVNGLDLEAKTGFVLIDGEERFVKLIDGEWQEAQPERGNQDTNMSAPDEFTQILLCAVDQAPRDMPYIEVLNAALYKKTEYFRESPELNVQGVRWYVEVEIRNLNDHTTATALYRVWRSDEGTLKATRVAID